jgi:dephospho-CoA kinase
MTMLIVALTGGIATGKSEVAKVLKQHGCYVHRADRAARELMRPHRRAWKQVVAHFGPKVLNPDQTINRSRLGAIVFSDEKERQFLNSLVHPLVLEKKKQAIRRLEKKGKYKVFVSEAALTIESGFVRFFDKIIVVHCPEEMQIKRLMQRDRISRREALQKIRSQMPSLEKQSYADYVIDTSGSLDNTERQTDRVYMSLLADYRRKLGSSRPTTRRLKAGS